MARHREYYKGKVVVSPNLGHGESCESMFACGSSMHQKCSDYALTNLLFSLCKYVSISEPLVIRPSLIPEFQHTPLPSKCYELRNVHQLFFLLLSLPLDSHLNPSKSLRVHRSPIYNVDYGHNMGITFCPHIQCASLNYHVCIAFTTPTYSVD
jgi:hypothetical protein